jgi:hypothetical protein
MEAWIISICLLIVAVFLVSAISRRITRATGRTRSLGFMASALWAVATVPTILGIAAVFALPLPWLILVAGVLGGTFGLSAQALAGRRAA